MGPDSNKLSGLRLKPFDVISRLELASLIGGFLLGVI